MGKTAKDNKFLSITMNSNLLDIVDKCVNEINASKTLKAERCTRSSFISMAVIFYINEAIMKSAENKATGGNKDA